MFSTPPVTMCKGFCNLSIAWLLSSLHGSCTCRLLRNRDDVACFHGHQLPKRDPTSHDLSAVLDPEGSSSCLLLSFLFIPFPVHLLLAVLALPGSVLLAPMKMADSILIFIYALLWFSSSIIVYFCIFFEVAASFFIVLQSTRFSPGLAVWLFFIPS